METVKVKGAKSAPEIREAIAKWARECDRAHGPARWPWRWVTVTSPSSGLTNVGLYAPAGHCRPDACLVHIYIFNTATEPVLHIVEEAVSAELSLRTLPRLLPTWGNAGRGRRRVTGHGVSLEMGWRALGEVTPSVRQIAQDIWAHERVNNRSKYGIYRRSTMSVESDTPSPGVYVEYTGYDKTYKNNSPEYDPTGGKRRAGFRYYVPGGSVDMFRAALAALCPDDVDMVTLATSVAPRRTT